MKSGEEKTVDGKNIIKKAILSQKTGEKIVIEKPVEVKPQETSISPLEQEAKKYKSAEEFVKKIQNESNIGKQGKLQEIPLNKIKGTDYPELDNALLTGKLSFDEADSFLPDNELLSENGKVTMPIEVIKNNDGTYSLQAGNHRVSQQLINGQKTIFANVSNEKGFSTESQLIDIWNKSQPSTPQGGVEQKVETKPKEVSVPREQLPVGKGEIKATALESRVKGTQNLVKGATPEQLEALGLEGTNTAHNDQQLADAAKYVADNQEEAIKVLTGEIPAPKGILRNAILSAMVDQGNKDTALGVKLSGLFSKRYGQEIQILSTINPNSPVKLLSELYKVNEARIQKRYGGKTVKEISTKLEGKMKDVAKKAKKYDWNDFISSIDTC